MTHWYVHRDRAIEQRAKRLAGITLTDSGIIMRFVRGARSFVLCNSVSIIFGRVVRINALPRNYDSNYGSVSYAIH